MTIEELQKRPEFVTLGSEQMKRWLVELCTNGCDYMRATEAVYHATTERSALAIINRLRNDPKIKRLSKDFFGQVDEEGTKTDALAILWKRINATTDDKVLIDYLKLYGEWKGFKAEKAAPETPPTGGDPTDEWELVRQMEEGK